MVEIVKDVYATCPVCGTKLIIYWDTYYEDFEGDIYKDTSVVWECVNGCLFDDDMIDNIDKEIENKIWDDT